MRGLKYYLFENAMRLKYGINYSVSAEEGALIMPILISSFVCLLKVYTEEMRKSPSVKDMIEQYVRGEISIQNQLEPIVAGEYNGVTIRTPGLISRTDRQQFMSQFREGFDERFLRGILEDDVIHTDAIALYYIYDGQIAARETLLFNGTESAFRISLAHRSLGMIPYFCTAMALGWIFEKFQTRECYRIAPTPRNGSFMMGCVEDIQVPQTPCEIKNLGNYTRYSYTPNHCLPRDKIYQMFLGVKA